MKESSPVSIKIQISQPSQIPGQTLWPGQQWERSTTPLSYSSLFPFLSGRLEKGSKTAFFFLTQIAHGGCPHLLVLQRYLSRGPRSVVSLEAPGPVQTTVS